MKFSKIILIFIVLSNFYNKMFLHNKYKNIYLIYLVVGSLSFLMHFIESLLNNNFFTFQYGANMLDEIISVFLITLGIFLLDIVIDIIKKYFHIESELGKGLLYGICVFIQVLIILFFLYSLYGFIATNIFHKFTFEFFMNSLKLVY